MAKSDVPVPKALNIELTYDGDRSQTAGVNLTGKDLKDHGVVLRIAGTDKFVWARIVDKSTLPERYITGALGSVSY